MATKARKSNTYRSARRMAAKSFAKETRQSLAVVWPQPMFRQACAGDDGKTYGATGIPRTPGFSPGYRNRYEPVPQGLVFRSKGQWAKARGLNPKKKAA